MFIVIYLDDFNRKHLTVAKNMMELKFFEDRFEVIEYSVAGKFTVNDYELETEEF